MSRLYIVNDSQGRSIGVFDNLPSAHVALLDHAESFLDDVLIITPDVNLYHTVLRVVAYVEGFDTDFCIEEVVTMNEVV